MSHAVDDTWETYTANDRIAGLFSPDECARIIDTYAAKGWISPEVRDTPDTDVHFRPRWILGRDPDAGWIFSRLKKAVRPWNAGHFNFRIDSCESLYLVRRQSETFSGWRSDLGARSASRCKLSTIVALSPRDAYTGGAIEFLETEFGAPTLDLSAGDAVVYASWLQYRIHPVTTGNFWTLSTWWMGSRPIR